MLRMHLRKTYRTFLPRLSTRGYVTAQSGVGEPRFLNMRAPGMFYVDKTKYAVKLLALDRAVCLKPPRTGKSLFIDTLELLYDIKYADDFEKNFAGLWVHENKPEGYANNFRVLRISLPKTIPADRTQYSKVKP